MASQYSNEIDRRWVPETPLAPDHGEEIPLTEQTKKTIAMLRDVPEVDTDALFRYCGWASRSSLTSDAEERQRIATDPSLLNIAHHMLRIDPSERDRAITAIAEAGAKQFAEEAMASIDRRRGEAAHRPLPKKK
jgi:hypothetical protein